MECSPPRGLERADLCHRLVVETDRRESDFPATLPGGDHRLRLPAQHALVSRVDLHGAAPRSEGAERRHRHRWFIGRSCGRRHRHAPHRHPASHRHAMRTTAKVGRIPHEDRAGLLARLRGGDQVGQVARHRRRRHISGRHLHAPHVLRVSGHEGEQLLWVSHTVDDVAAVEGRDDRLPSRAGRDDDVVVVVAVDVGNRHVDAIRERAG